MLLHQVPLRHSDDSCHPNFNCVLKISYAGFFKKEMFSRVGRKKQICSMLTLNHLDDYNGVRPR